MRREHLELDEEVLDRDITFRALKATLDRVWARSAFRIRLLPEGFYKRLCSNLKQRYERNYGGEIPVAGNWTITS